MTAARRIRLALVFGLAAVAVPEFAAGQGGGTDRVYYRDRKKDGAVSTASGELKESAAGIQVISGGKTLVTVSPADVVRVEYSTLAGVGGNERLKSNSDENREIKDAKDAAGVRNAYAAAAKQAGPDADAKTRRFLAFREAVWAARAADAQTGEAFAAEAKDAVEKLTAFAKANPKTWEVWPAAKLAGRLNAELGQWKDAEAAFALLGKNPDLPADLRADARVAELTAIIRGGNRIGAEPVADELGKDRTFPASGPARDKLTVLTAVLKAAPPVATADGSPAKPADLVKKVEDVIAKTTDAGVRAAARNALGEYYLANNMLREAMYEFLWVETVWNQDRDEVIHAVVRLADIFAKLGKADRADEYKEKLPRVKGA